MLVELSARPHLKIGNFWRNGVLGEEAVSMVYRHEQIQKLLMTFRQG